MNSARSRFKLGLSGKVAAGMLACGVAIVCVVGSLRYMVARASLEEQAQSVLDSTVGRLKNTLAPSVYEYDERTRDSTVQAEFDREEVVAVTITNEHGEVGFQLCRWPEELKQTRPAYWKDSAFLSKESDIFFSQAGGKARYLGKVRVELDPYVTETRLVRRLIWEALLSVFIVAAMALTTFLLISRKLVMPLNRLRESILGATDVTHRPSGILRGQSAKNFSKSTRDLEAGFSEVRELNSRYADLINALQEREERLKRSESRLTTTLDSIRDGIITTDSDGRIRKLNPSALNWIQPQDREEPIGMLVADALQLQATEDSIGRESAFPIPRAVLSGSRPMASRDMHLKVPGGELRRVSVACYPLSAAEDANGTVICIRDITDRTKLEEQLRQSQKMDAIGRLAGGIAHDMNNMLGGVLGGAEMLRHRLRSHELAWDAVQEYVNMILNSCESAAGLSRRLLGFARKGNSEHRPFDINKIVADTVALLQRSVDRRIDVRHRLEADPSVVFGDTSLIQNAILNLGINARDAMHGSGTITISTSNVLVTKSSEEQTMPIKDGSYIEVCVEDTGSGIPPEILSKIFEPFFTTKGEGKGTGLGLASVFTCVQEHFGDVRVESIVGEGTRFYLRFPVEVSRQISTESSGTLAPISGLTILVADDEEIMRQAASAMLVELGHTVIQAKDGAQALHYALRHRGQIDLVLLDMNMPELNGEQVFHRIQEFGVLCRVVIASGIDERERIEAMFARGLAGFLPKPYRMDGLSACINAAMQTTLVLSR